MLTSAKSFDVLATGSVTSGPNPNTLCLLRASTSMSVSTWEHETGQVVCREFPLRVVGSAEDQPAPEVRLAETALKRQKLSDFDVGVFFLPVELPVCRRGETGGPLFVEVERGADERFVRPHALADVVAAATFVPAGGHVQLKPGRDIRVRGVPAQIERADQHVGKARVHCVAELKRRRFECGVRKRKHHHGSVVRAEQLGLAHVPHHRRHGPDREAGWRRLRKPDDVSVRILDGVGVVAKVEQRGVEAGLRLRSGLHAEITKGVASVQLSLGRHGQEERQRAGHCCRYHSSHGCLLVQHGLRIISRPARDRPASSSCRTTPAAASRAGR